MLKSVYLMPGMAANPRIFEFLKFPKKIQVIYLSWISPEKDESLENYAKRMSKRIINSKPILIDLLKTKAKSFLEAISSESIGE